MNAEHVEKIGFSRFRLGMRVYEVLGWAKDAKGKTTKKAIQIVSEKDYETCKRFPYNIEFPIDRPNTEFKILN